MYSRVISERDLPGDLSFTPYLHILVTWPCQVKECKILLEQSLLTGWLAVGIVNLVCNFIRQSPVEHWNEVETSCHGCHSNQMHKKEKPCACRIDRRVRVSVKVLKFCCKRIDLLRLINNCQQQSCRYQHRCVLVVWKPLSLGFPILVIKYA